jgi:hypothetical protein
LDWSWDPHVAAFIAAKSAIEQSSEQFAVWALESGDLRFEMEMRGFPALVRTGPPPPWSISIVTAPSASNQRLHAQRGLFTLLEGEPADAALEELIGTTTLTRLIKFTLPTTEARELLMLLGLYGVTAARVFPGYDGVVQQLRDQP